ncbi:hypothetical protein BDV38DRAFT_290444 [Aspergillus pseudotamarii]|uniref:Uncharacterized protein n=1 Tax=Aspergillus pseudotamarii TaxID=132259 RepID=A0A5N6SBN6_ASPPS|nr:uncharacterized protein BDV38DRAFT_290444 [Aspergillus pseudotamarii]KAE8131259.1 hypothetical protein BDV38DRAFT_290444 [Aspergillus pseudotamarii]
METLNEAVSAGDLILLYAPGHTPCMLLVESSPDSHISNPKTSSITVQKVKVHYRLKPGYCIVSGPDVYYNEEEDEDASGDDTSTEAGCDISSRPLSAYVTDFPAESEVEYRVNPHGRDVLRYYWGGHCPFCYMNGWYCPGCGPAMQFPDLFGGCGVDQSCPVCYGYDFAMNDKVMLRKVEEYESRLWRTKSESKEYRAELRQEILAMVRERYALIDARRQVMGFSRYDVNHIVENWFKDDDE